MNILGTNVKAALACTGVKSSEMLVLHDELEIKFGTYKLSTPDMSFRGHKGLRSIQNSL